MGGRQILAKMTLVALSEHLDIVKLTPIFGRRIIVVLLELDTHIRDIRTAGSGLRQNQHRIQIERLIRETTGQVSDLHPVDPIDTQRYPIPVLMARLMPALQVLLALDKSSLSTLNPNQRKYHTKDETEFLRATFIHVTLPHR